MRVVRETTIAGKIIHRKILIPSGNHKQKRRGRLNVTKESVKRNNMRLAIWRLWMLLANNFDSSGSHVTLTYAGEEPKKEQAAADRKKMIAKLRKEFRKQGKELKYVVVTEFENKMVYASYNQNVNVTYTVTDEYRTLGVSWSCTAEGATADTTNNKLELDVTHTPTVTGENIVFNIADTYTPYPTASEPNPAPVSITSCDKIIIIINGGKPIIRDNPVKSGSNYPYTLNLNNFRTSGVYNITVIGEIDGHYYSGPVIPLTVDIK